VLNPAEQLCNNGKRVDLANDAPTSRDDLRSRVRRSLIRRRCSPPPSITRSLPCDYARLYQRRGQWLRH